MTDDSSDDVAAEEEGGRNSLHGDERRVIGVDGSTSSSVPLNDRETGISSCADARGVKESRGSGGPCWWLRAAAGTRVQLSPRILLHHTP